MTLFDHLQNITYEKRAWQKLSEDERKTANAYMINRYLSMEYKYLEIINEVQTLNLPIQYLYNLYISVIPKQKKYLKYLKKSVKDNKGDDIKLLAEVFKVSQREAKLYWDKLDTKQIESIRLQVEGIKQKKKK